MSNVLDKIDVSRIVGIEKQILPLWVYGTLRTGQRFHYYLVDCSARVGEYRMDGTLMQKPNGDVFLRKDGSMQNTAGELYRVSIAGLLRIFHLENQSGSFPKSYDLAVSRVFDSATDKTGIALWFRRKEEEPIPCSDITKHKTLFEELVEFIQVNTPSSSHSEVDNFLLTKLKEL